MTLYYRPLVVAEPASDRLPLAGGACLFRDVAVLERGQPSHVIPARDVPPAILARLTAPRAPVAGLTMDRARIMGILNVTPDSFSDGGDHADLASATARAARATRCFQSRPGSFQSWLTTEGAASPADETSVMAAL